LFVALAAIWNWSAISGWLELGRSEPTLGLKISCSANSFEDAKPTDRSTPGLTIHFWSPSHLPNIVFLDLVRPDDEGGHVSGQLTGCFAVVGASSTLENTVKGIGNLECGENDYCLYVECSSEREQFLMHGTAQDGVSDRDFEVAYIYRPSSRDLDLHLTGRFRQSFADSQPILDDSTYKDCSGKGTLLDAARSWAW
jgi:hypothetical protein